MTDTTEQSQSQVPAHAGDVHIPCNLRSSLCTLRLNFVRLCRAVVTANNAPAETQHLLDTGGGLKLIKPFLRFLQTMIFTLQEMTSFACRTGSELLDHSIDEANDFIVGIILRKV